MPSTFVFLGFLLTSASAGVLAPKVDVFKRAACNRDNCLRAVAPSAGTSTSIIRSQDCAAFLLKTVTPCAVTTTVTVSTTSTAPIVVISSTVTSTTTAITTETIYFDLPTKTITTPISTITSTITNRNGVPTDDGQGGAGTNGLAKRTVIPERANELIERAAATTCPSVSSPANVPAYAAACSGVVRYSSACSCIGATASTLTLTAQTTTVTSTVPATVTPTQTSITTTISTMFSTVSTSVGVGGGSVTVAGPATTITTTTNLLCPTFTAFAVIDNVNYYVVNDIWQNRNALQLAPWSSNPTPAKYVINWDSTVNSLGLNDPTLYNGANVWQADPYTGVVPNPDTIMSEIQATTPGFVSAPVVCTIFSGQVWPYLYCDRQGQNDVGFYHCDNSAYSKNVFVHDRDEDTCERLFLYVGSAC